MFVEIVEFQPQVLPSLHGRLFRARPDGYRVNTQLQRVAGGFEWCGAHRLPRFFGGRPTLAETFFFVVHATR
jgi:hypothetical protein